MMLNACVITEPPSSFNNVYHECIISGCEKALVKRLDTIQYQNRSFYVIRRKKGGRESWSSG